MTLWLATHTQSAELHQSGLNPESCPTVISLVSSYSQCKIVQTLLDYAGHPFQLLTSVLAPLSSPLSQEQQVLKEMKFRLRFSVCSLPM